MKEADIKELRLRLAGLSVYRQALDNPVAHALERLLMQERLDACRLAGAYAEVFRACAAANCLDNPARELENALLRDENPYTRCLAAGRAPSPILVEAAMRDLSVMRDIACLDPVALGNLLLPAYFSADTFPVWKQGAPGPLFSKEGGALADYLSAYHKKNGCGIYTVHAAFLWNNGMVPILHSDPVVLQDLKGYELPRKRVLENTESFLRGLPASNMLLYGDRGTGKSSTVHAILNQYRDQGLRMLELPKEGLRELPRISEELGSLPLKFIIFIDDLSFSEADDSFGALKAILEGSLAARPENLLIYATSNRRHLVRETHAQRQGDEIHAMDAMQEQLSLSDRFGITVTFLNPDRAQYYEILDGLAADRRLDMDPDALHAAAERWALSRGGRSPRVARQFIDYAQSRLLRGLPLD